MNDDLAKCAVCDVPITPAEIKSKKDLVVVNGRLIHAKCMLTALGVDT